MSSVHLPVLVMILPLAAALILPVLPFRRSLVRSGVVAAGALAVALVGAIASLGSVLVGPGSYRYTFGGWSAAMGVEISVTPYIALLAVVVTLLALLIVTYSLRDSGGEIPDSSAAGYYTLILVAVFSMLGMVYTNDLFNLYVFMEMLSIASCAIVTITGKRENLYAGLKYLIIGTVGSITVLLGIAILYRITGTLNMSLTEAAIAAAEGENPVNLRIALVMILAGLGVKAAVFPLHTWLPDAHSVAPAPSSALLSALVVKVYLLGALKVLFVVYPAGVLQATAVPTVLIWTGLVAMLSGSALALGQQKVKRILAYSTVSHIGYIVLGFGLGSPAAISAALFHVIAHAVMKTGLFMSVGAVIHRTGKHYVGEYAGVGYRMPLTMLVFTLCALGMIGIPGTNGFMSKWYLILAAAEAGQGIVLPFILGSSFLNALYYVPIVTRAFIQRSTAEDHVMKWDRLPRSSAVSLVIVAVIVVVTGLFPQLIMSVLRQGFWYAS